MNGNHVCIEQSLGERVLFCKLLRDGILKHFNPWKLRDLQYILEFRCFKGLLSNEDLKHCFRTLWGLRHCHLGLEFPLNDWEKRTVREMKWIIGNACSKSTSRNMGQEVRGHPENCIHALETKEDLIREYGMLAYIPKLIYETALAGVHVSRTVGSIPKGVADVYLYWAANAGLSRSVFSAIIRKVPSKLIHYNEADEDNGSRFTFQLVRGYSKNIGAECLMAAAKNGHIHLLQYLIEEHNVNANASTEYGERALYCAAERGKLDAVRYLVEHGADVAHREGGEDRSAILPAAREGHVDVVRFLVDNGADIHGKDAWGRDALYNATSGNQVPVVQFLIQHGADIETKGDKGATPLHVAAEEGSIHLVRFLVEAGADVDMTDDDERTALHAAARHGHLDVVQFLVKRNADIHATSRRGMTPLHAAASSYRPSVMVARYLVECGAEVDAATDDDHTAVTVAVFVGNVDVARYLIEIGACIGGLGGDADKALRVAEMIYRRRCR